LKPGYLFLTIVKITVEKILTQITYNPKKQYFLHNNPQILQNIGNKTDNFYQPLQIFKPPNRTIALVNDPCLNRIIPPLSILLAFMYQQI